MTQDEQWRNLPQMFFDKAAELGDAPFLWRKERGNWHSLTWREAADQVASLAQSLRALGIQPGDRVALISESRPEWAISDLAIMTAGAITVPHFTTNTSDDHHYVLKHTGSKGAIISTNAVAKRFVPALKEAGSLQFLLYMDTLALEDTPDCPILPWQQAASGSPPDYDLVAKWYNALPKDADCSFICTSGTGGNPKAVRLSHRSILANCHGARLLLESSDGFFLGGGQDSFLSFLPLSHSYERTAGQFFPISLGAQIYYAEGVEKLLPNLAETRPTLMISVPRLYEMMRHRLLKSMSSSGKFKHWLFLQTLRTGEKHYRGQWLGPIDRVLFLLTERLVRSKIRSAFGGRLRAMISGGAALNHEIGHFFMALGVPILQGYGQTEAGPVVSVNPPRRIKIETVGPPLPGVEVKIAEDGEILVRGDLLMNGYWQDQAATDHALQQGWLHTGDIGHIDGDGYLKITDRKKDIIVLSGGDNVSPSRVEGSITLEPEIAQAMVAGDGRPHLVALLVPQTAFCEDWAKNHKIAADLVSLSQNPAFHSALQQTIGRINARLSPIEKIRHFIVAPEPFTTENGLLTASMKIRRHKIREVYGKALDALYEKS